MALGQCVLAGASPIGIHPSGVLWSHGCSLLSMTDIAPRREEVTRWALLRHRLWRGPLRRLFDRAALEFIDSDRDLLGPGVAHLLNWAVGPTGYVAQAGLWFNEPVVPEHRKNQVVVRHVNERIVEVPYALAAAGQLRSGAHVLDVGATESTLSLSLASLGFNVIALDPRPYPIAHPMLTAAATGVEGWEPVQPLDAIFCVSTIEHLGLSGYGQGTIDEDLDRKTAYRMRSWLRPGGELVLTVPFGVWSIDRFQRTYDDKHLQVLLDGWTVVDRRTCVQVSHDCWEPVSGDGSFHYEEGRRGVALIRATPDRAT